MLPEQIRPVLFDWFDIWFDEKMFFDSQHPMKSRFGLDTNMQLNNKYTITQMTKIGLTLFIFSKTAA